MERITLPDGISADKALFYNSVLDGAFPLPTVLDYDPTTTELKVNQVAFNPSTSKLFININGVVYNFVSSGADNTGAGYSIVANGTGTVYQLTNSYALLNFGTSSPSITIDKAGTYLLYWMVRIEYNGAQFSSPQTVRMKLRRTNNTAADIGTSLTEAITNSVSTILPEFGPLILGSMKPQVYTTTNTNDIIQIQGEISATPDSAGSMDAMDAQLLAVRLY